MKRGWIILSLVALYSFGMASNLDPENDFNSANALYEEGKLEEAVVVYERLANQYGSRQIEFNLGNAYYRLDEIPQAIIHYERALRFDPQNEDVQHNLNRARLQTVDKIEAANSNRFSVWWSSNLLHIGADSWAHISLLFGLIMMLSAAGYFFLSHRPLRRLGLNFAVMSLVICILTYWFSLSAKSAQLSISEAIIMTPKVEIQSSPSESSTELLILHEGTKVEILRESKDWSEVKLTNGQVGWIKSTDLELI